MEIKNIIKERRLQFGYTMKQLASAIGVAESTVSRWESGNISNMTRDKVALLAEVLHLSPSVIMGWEDADDLIPASAMVKVYDGIAAGCPAFLDDQIVGYLPTTLPHPEDYAAIKVHGNSMINAGIVDGCTVMIRRQATAENGQIVACRVNCDEVTLKRFIQKEAVVILMPENPDYEPLIVPASKFDTGEAQILGVLKQVIIDY